MCLKKQFPSKTAYYGQLWSEVLTKKETETVRLSALKFQHVMEKGWPIEKAASVKRECKEQFYRGLLKNWQKLRMNGNSKIQTLLRNIPSLPYTG